MPNNNDDLVDALIEDGIVPTKEAIAKLDAQITELAGILVDYALYRIENQIIKKRLIHALIRRLQWIINNRKPVK